MGLFDWLRGKPPPRDVSSVGPGPMFPEVEEPEDYEALIDALGELSGLALSARCRVDDRAVSLEITNGALRYVHVQEGLFADLESLLPVLNGWIGHGSPRRLVEYDHDRFGEELGVAFVDDRAIAAARADGWILRTRDAPIDGTFAVDGVELTGAITFHDDGAPRRGVLARDTTIDGIPCAGGAPIELDMVGRGRPGPRGTLRHATLASPITVGPASLPAGTRLHLYEEVPTVAVAELAAPLVLAGLQLPVDSELSFDEDGHLYSVTTRGDAEVLSDGPFRGRVLPPGAMVSFENGAWDLEDVYEPEPLPPSTAPTAVTRTLDEAETIGAYALPVGARVTTREGELCGVELPRDTSLAGFPAAAGFVGFSLGEIASLELTEAFELDGLRCKAGTSLLLWSDGAVSEATLDAPAMIAGFDLPAGSRVGFYEEIGNPALIAVPTSVTLGPHRCIAGQVLELDEDGRVQRVGHVTDSRHRLTYELRNDGAPYIDSP